jgi:voltage-gated potassium channel
MEKEFSSITKYAKLKYALLVMFSITILGISGFMIIEGLSFVDALYFSIITISTVGYSDIYISSILGKVFTIILIIVSWVAFAYSISVITSNFIEGGIGNMIYKYRHQNRIKKMKNHAIIVGYGRNGSRAAEELVKRNTEFIVIEKNHNLIISNLDKRIQFHEGDATVDEVLIETGILRAKSILLTLPIDADNLFITISARALNPKIQIITRATSESAEKKLLIAGANEVVMPEYVGGSHMAAMVDSVDLVHFLDQISISGKAMTNLVEIECSELPEHLMNHSIFDLGIRSNSGANIVGYKTATGEFVINPTPDRIILPNSKLFVLGNPSEIIKMKTLLHIH